MNKENIRKIIDQIKVENGKYFRMNRWISDLNGDELEKYDACGTALCIAGTAHFIRLNESNEFQELIASNSGAGITYAFSHEYQACRWMDITLDQAHVLFYMEDRNDRPVFDRLPPRVRAFAGVEVLEHLMETNEVDWPRAIEHAKHMDKMLSEAQEKQIDATA